MITRLAKVIDNEDNSRLGRVKVEIIPELQDLPENLLPWAVPKQDYDTDNCFRLDIPEKDSYILVSIDDTWTSFVYDGSMPFSENPKCKQLAEDFIDNKSGVSPTSWRFSKSPQYLMYEKSDTNEVGIIFDEGIHVKYDGSAIELKNENVSVKCNSSTFEVTTGDNVSIKCNGSVIELKNGANMSIEMSSSQVKINGDHLVVT